MRTNQISLRSIFWAQKTHIDGGSAKWHRSQRLSSGSLRFSGGLWRLSSKRYSDPRHRKRKSCEEKSREVCTEVPVTECEVRSLARLFVFVLLFEFEFVIVLLFVLKSQEVCTEVPVTECEVRSVGYLWDEWRHDATLWQMVYFWLCPPSRWPEWPTARPAWPRNRWAMTRSMDVIVCRIIIKWQSGCDKGDKVVMILCWIITLQTAGGRGDLHGAQLHNDPDEHHRDQDGTNLCQHD